MQFVTNVAVKINTAITVTLPSGFSVISGAYCRLKTGTYNYNTNTIYDTTLMVFKVTILEPIPISTTIVLWAQVTLPTTVATYTVAFAFFTDNTFTQLL